MIVLLLVVLMSALGRTASAQEPAPATDPATKQASDNRPARVAPTADSLQSVEAKVNPDGTIDRRDHVVGQPPATGDDVRGPQYPLDRARVSGDSAQTPTDPHPANGVGTGGRAWPGLILAGVAAILLVAWLVSRRRSRSS
jgi:LPXTG-motif cell wall-anchored protein